ncbi:MAG: hypothetical protein K1X95_05030 [Acidimicrobiia bacterium]|nr:hypothetical protein [Acidimicrobiia bacterium]
MSRDRGGLAVPVELFGGRLKLPPISPPGFLVGTGLELRRRLLRLADRILPPEIAVLDHAAGLAEAAVLGAIVELGVADHIVDAPRSAADLAEVIEGPVDAESLHRMLRYAAVFDLVALDADGCFHATPFTRVLDSRAADSIAPWCRYFVSKSNVAAWADLAATVRTGESAFRRVHGASVWDYFDAHPDEGRTFAAAMRHLTEGVAPSVADACPFDGAGTVCDVAGGSGALLAAFLSRHPSSRGVLVEAALVLEVADRYLGEAGVRDRVTFVEGDIFGGFAAEAGLYLMKDILHDWDDAACARILANTRAAMPPGARLVLVENVIEPNDIDHFVTFADMQMMVALDEGRQRSVAELQSLLCEAGFEPGPVRKTATVVHLVEGIAV